MNWDDYRKRFEEEGLRQGRSPRFIAEHLSYAETLAAAGLPIIFDASHLSALLGYEEATLRQALDDPEALYFAFSIPKRQGGFRQIYQPRDSLREIQVWILEHILNRCSVHEAATAFVRARSIKLNAAPHVGQPMVLSLDLRDFFPSVAAGRVGQVFRDLGYSDVVVTMLTAMTTLYDGLPQGAPTSPALSNLVMRTADEELSRVATTARIKYSRYADDLSFSGRFHAGEIINEVRRTVLRHGFRLNEAKTRLMLPHQRQEVTGVVVNKHLQAPRKLRRALRQEVHFIERFGIEAHEARKNAVYLNCLDHLRGVAEFVRFLNSADRDAERAISVLGRVRFGQPRSP